MGKRLRNAVSSDEEDSPDPKGQKVAEQKDADYDDDDMMFMDEEDREKLNMMSEKEREIEIFNRIQQRELNKTREEIKKKLKMNQRAEDKKAEAAETSKESRPSRKAQKSRAAKKSDDDDEEDGDEEVRSKSSGASSDADEAVNEDGLFSSSDEDEEITLNSKETAKSKAKRNEDSEEEPDELSLKYHRPSELANAQSKKQAMDTLMSKRKNKQKADEKRKQSSQKAALDIDEIFGDDDSKSGSSSSSSSRSSSRASSRSFSPETKPEISDRTQLSRIRLSRHKLAQFVHAPFFKKMAIGCFVRIGIGQHKGKPVYRVVQIVDVVETAKVYQVEKTRTNKGLKLKHGPDARVYRLEFASNSDFSPSEFDHWVNFMKEKNLPLPTMDFIERKEKDITNALEYSFTNADIDQIVKEKTRFSKAPTNFAFQKGELMKSKEFAEQSGNVQLVQELQQKLDELETRADTLDRQRSQKLSVVTWINQRNRDHMKQSFLGGGVFHTDESGQDDPFTRKSGKMKVVSGTAKSKLAATLSGAPIDSDVGAPESKVLVTSSSPELPRIHDLFSAHDIEIDIQLKLPAAGPSRMPANIDNQSSARVVLPKPAGSRSLTLEEYKRKRGLI
uniref:Plus3 domain-containing protein n=1 Tax=Ditylenchus dipsaci TaxID=166011 RepID=A0A915E9E7_9BILA